MRVAMSAVTLAVASPTHGNALPSGPSDFNLYGGLIALGVGLFGCLLARYSNGGHGPRPRGDALSWLVHTRLGAGPKSRLSRQLDLGVLLSATYGELLVVSAYCAWLILRFGLCVLHAALQRGGNHRTPCWQVVWPPRRAHDLDDVLARTTVRRATCVCWACRQLRLPRAQVYHLELGVGNTARALDTLS